MTRKLLLAFTMLLALPLSAQAGVLDFADRQLSAAQDSVQNGLGSVWKFLGSSQPETGLPTVESTPMVQIDPIRRTVEAKAPVLHRRSLLASLNISLPQLPALRTVAKPSVEKADKRLFCVEFARNLSGLNIFGDAKLWWDRAKNLYSRAEHPLEEAVMVFSGSSRLKRGHLAVVSEVISPREIRVEQANWMNRGEIDHATPILDVSDKNDWSKVRVWDMPSQQFGTRIYAVSGFILKPLVREASNN